MPGVYLYLYINHCILKIMELFFDYLFLGKIMGIDGDLTKNEYGTIGISPTSW